MSDSKREAALHGSIPADDRRRAQRVEPAQYDEHRVRRVTICPSCRERIPLGTVHTCPTPSEGETA